MKKQKEIIHMGNNNRCNTCYNDGYNQALTDVKRIIDKRIKECKLCQSTDKYQEQIEEDQIMIDNMNFIKSELFKLNNRKEGEK